MGGFSGVGVLRLLTRGLGLRDSCHNAPTKNKVRFFLGVATWLLPTAVY